MRLAYLISALLLSTGIASSQTAEDRAGEIKQWRERCAEPDVDLRTANIEGAIDTGDVTIIRICSRQALEADDADVRNLGLRAALASVERITFSVEMPEALAKAKEAAGNDQKKLATVDRLYVANDWGILQSGLVFELSEATVTGGSSVWFPLAGLSERNDRYSGKAHVTGSRVTWVGRASLSVPECKLDVGIEPGAELVGVFHCDRSPPFPVRAKLL